MAFQYHISERTAETTVGEFVREFVHVESCLQHYFHIPLLWGRNGTAPDYLVLVGGLLTK